MCLQCDGFTEEEVARSHDLIIRVHGFVRLQVAEGGETWTYSVGLWENSGFPELFCAGVSPELQNQLVQTLGEEVLEHGYVAPEVLTDLDLALAPVQLEPDMVGMWCNRYHRAPEADEFRLIIPGASWFCCADHAKAFANPEVHQ